MSKNDFAFIKKIGVDKTPSIDAQTKFLEWVKEESQPYQNLMTYYRCAMMRVETKFKVLNEDLKLQYDQSPIEAIHCRLKSQGSIMEKMSRRNLDYSVQALEENIFDIAGVRVICAFKADIYMLAEAFLSQDDVTLIERKDYIENPKKNGYRSLHLIVSVPIFLHNERKMMKVEVQFRTLAMDLWASAEHKLRYKKDHELTEGENEALLECAAGCAEIDEMLASLHKRIIALGEE